MRCICCNKRLTLSEEKDEKFFNNDALCYDCRKIAFEDIETLEYLNDLKEDLDE